LLEDLVGSLHGQHTSSNIGHIQGPVLPILASEVRLGGLELFLRFSDSIDLGGFLFCPLGLGRRPIGGEFNGLFNFVLVVPNDEVP